MEENMPKVSNFAKNEFHNELNKAIDQVCEENNNQSTSELDKVLKKKFALSHAIKSRFSEYPFFTEENKESFICIIKEFNTNYNQGNESMLSSIWELSKVDQQHDAICGMLVGTLGAHYDAILDGCD